MEQMEARLAAATMIPIAGGDGSERKAAAARSSRTGRFVDSNAISDMT
jgi:hypothetical protein